MDTITSLIETSCRRFESRTAFLRKKDGRWHETTYAALRETSDRIAAGLSGRGFQPGEHAALMAASSPEWVMAYLGILKAGGVVVPVDKDLREIEVHHILSHGDVRVLFADSARLGLALGMADGLAELGLIVTLPSSAGESLPPGTGSTRCTLLSFGEFLQAGTATLQEQRPEDPALILYTSGTTGRTKGAMISHSNIVSNIRGAVEHLEVDHSIHTLSFLPINHVFEQVCGVLLPLSLGGKVSFCESLKKLGDNMAEVKPTFFVGVPAVYRMILDRILNQIEKKALSRLLFTFPVTRPLITAAVRRKLGNGTIFISGGAALDPAISRDFTKLGVTLFQGYGITETSPVIAAESRKGVRPGTVGRVLAGVEVHIDGPNYEEVGEILVRGPNVMQGYYKDPHATSEAIVAGWYRTGDLGRLDSDGFLSICGRVKSLIVTSNGKNVYPEEVEIEILKSPYIAEVVVYAHRDGAGEEEIAAVIRPNQEAIDNYLDEQGKDLFPHEDVTLIMHREVKRACDKLAAYKRVKRVAIRHEEFPKTTTHKIKRFELELILANSDVSTQRNSG